MADETADNLREMAQHRGLKLVRSRRRKPGTGDFGKFGLTDDKGKPLLGIGEDGLTASAEDIENYLRLGAANTWQQSARITPDPPKGRGKQAREDNDAAGPSRSTRASRSRAAYAITQSAGPPASQSRREGGRKTELGSPSVGASGVMPQRAEVAGSSAPAQFPAAVPKLPKPAPSLVLRAAKPADAAGLAKLLEQLGAVTVSRDHVARNLAALRKASAGFQVAELGRLVGCIGWAVVPTLQRGAVGRITVLMVDEAHRRQGIGTRLLADAQAALARKGCTLIEAISDIEIRNSHNFFRAAQFEQASYRFVRKIAR